MIEYTEADFEKAMKNPKVKKAWAEFERFEKYLSQQPQWLQEAVEKRLIEKIKELKP